MAANSPQQKGRDIALSALDGLVQALSIAKDACGIPPAQAAIASVTVLLTMIRDSMANKQDFVDLGLACADVCQTLDRGLNGRELHELSQSVLAAIEKLTSTIGEIQGKITVRRERNVFFRVIHSRDDKDAIIGWKQDLGGILQIFNTELLLNNHMLLLDIRNNTTPGKGDNDNGREPTNTSLGELPPPSPRACFGRDGLIEEIVGLAETLNPIALIGPGGIGKTSVALAVLHHDRIKGRFGENRRFIRCDQFPASRANFLNRLSKVIGAGVRNPEGLTPLWPSLTSKEIFMVLDNAESILDPQGTDAREIYGLVGELSRLDNVCLCITSRISIVPPDCKCIDVPTLSMDAAHSTFYRIYDNDKRSDAVDKILERLDFHPLSVTLLATVAHQNKWGNNRLVKEWEQRQTGVLQTGHNESLALTIELSLASPMFQKLGRDAREILGVIAFFPQGIDENNIDWLFPTISNRTAIFDRLCTLSLTYQSNGFIRMLAPLRDYLRLKDPGGSALLRKIKGIYFSRLSIVVNPEAPGFDATKWITLEDVNVEHLLDVFTTIEPDLDETWDACNGFMGHLYWRKPRLTVLGAKIERLPDDHRWKPRCLLELSLLFDSVGNRAEQKRLLTQALASWRKRKDDYWTASALRWLSEANRMLGLREEGIKQASESLEIYERLGYTTKQVLSLVHLAQLYSEDGQLEAAEEVTIRAIKLAGENQEFSVCKAHRILGDIARSKGDTEKALNHYEDALKIASKSNMNDQIFWIHHNLAWLFRDEGKFEEAHSHVEQAKLHTAGNKYYLGRIMEMNAWVWYRQQSPKDATSEASRAIEIFEKLGAARDSERCRDILAKVASEQQQEQTG